MITLLSEPVVWTTRDGPPRSEFRSNPECPLSPTPPRPRPEATPFALQALSPASKVCTLLESGRVTKHMRLHFAQARHDRGAMAAERADDCVSRMIAGATSGFAAGAIGGAVTANWSEVPLVLRNKAWPALQRTGQQHPLPAFILTDRHARHP